MAPPSPSSSTVHLLTVHGVGDHDPLSNLLRTYQSFRANLTSVEAPVLGEDQIPGWRLTRFEEGATPPYLKLEPRVRPPDGGIGAVCYFTRTLVSAITFGPTLVAMAVPIAGTAWLTSQWPTFAEVWWRAWSLDTLGALACFMVYVVCCAAHELAHTWRQVIRTLNRE